MALTGLISTIQDATKAEVDALLAEARGRAAALEQKAAARARLQFQRELEGLRSALRFAAAQQRSQRQIDSRHALLREREAMLARVRSGLSDWIESLSAAEEAQLLAGLVESARTRVASGALRANGRTAARLGTPAGFTVEIDETLADGLEIRSADGRIVIDLSFHLLLDDFWRRYRPEAAGVLFGSELNVEENKP